MPWSRVNTKYSMHWVQHTPSTAYAEYSIHRVLYTLSTVYTEYCLHRILHHPRIDCLALPASLWTLSGRCCTQFSTFPQLRVDEWIESKLPLLMPPDLPPPDSLPPDWPPSDQSPPDQPHPSTCPILFDPGLQVHLWVHSISASVHRQTLLNLGIRVHLWVHSIPASKCISKLAPSWPPSSSLSSLDLSLQVYL